MSDKFTILGLVDRLKPDFRGGSAMATFGLVFFLFWMIYQTPDLLQDSAFTGLAGLLVGSGGIGTVLSFAFGGTKTGSEVMKSQNQALMNVPEPQPDPQVQPDPSQGQVK